MNKLLPVVAIGILVLGGLGAGALQSDNIQPVIEISDFEEQSSSSASMDYTHTVLVEVGTATWCSACPASNSAWHTIYEGGNYNFEYTELVYDMNSVAQSRFYQFNPRWVPTSYWDGGEYVYPGTNTGTFYSYLDLSGSRVVPDLVASLNVVWLGNAEIEISYDVVNNDASDYPGRLRIYVIELESTLWNDYSGNPYYHAFLDFAANQVINIPAGDTLSDTIVWDGAASGYPGITQNNIQVILAVFDDTPHQSYSDPPSGNPFSAYYCDECISATPQGGANNPPGVPDIDGPTNARAGEEYEYTFSAVDPDGDDVYYWILWGDNCPAVEWMGPYASGEEVTVSHIFQTPGDFTIGAKAKDIYDAEGNWGYLDVAMPKNKAMTNTFFLRFLQQFPNAFPVLRLLLGL